MCGRRGAGGEGGLDEEDEAAGAQEARDFAQEARVVVDLWGRVSTGGAGSGTTDPDVQRARVDEVEVSVGVGDVRLVEVAQLEAAGGQRARVGGERRRAYVQLGGTWLGAGQRRAGCYSGATDLGWTGARSTPTTSARGNSSAMSIALWGGIK